MMMMVMMMMLMMMIMNFAIDTPVAGYHLYVFVENCYPLFITSQKCLRRFLIFQEQFSDKLCILQLIWLKIYSDSIELVNLITIMKKLSTLYRILKPSFNAKQIQNEFRRFNLRSGIKEGGLKELKENCPPPTIKLLDQEALSFHRY